jgi:hypothetical protein
MFLIEYVFGVAQNAYHAVFTSPPSFSIEGNIYAEYLAGSFVRIKNVDQGGAALTATINNADGIDHGVRFTTGGAGTIVFNGNTLNLSSTEFIPPVPEPGGLLLVTTALLGWRWRPKSHCS